MTKKKLHLLQHRINLFNIEINIIAKKDRKQI